jgi:hypothetical protein
MLRSGVIVIAALGFISQTAAGQEVEPRSVHRSGLSLLFETTIGARLNRQPNPGLVDARWYVAWDLGPMVNRGNWALGATFLLGADEDGARWGIRPRYRRRLGRKTALDLGAGVLLGGSSNAGVIQSYPGVTALVGLQHGRWLGLSLEMQAVSTELVDYTHYDPYRVTISSGMDVAWLVSARASGLGAVVVSLAQLVVGAIAVGSADFGL